MLGTLPRRLIILLIILPLFSLFGFAATQVNLFGPATLLRTEAAPRVFAFGFPALPGTARLHVINGSPSGTNRASDASVKINGELIFGASDFNQNVSRLDTDIPTSVQNTIQVMVASAPGCFLVVSVTQLIDADGAGRIDESGGQIEVTDTTSPLYGVSLHFAPDSLEAPGIVRIKSVDHPAIPMPEPLEPLGPAISIESTSKLLDSVIAEIPFPEYSENQLRLFFCFDEEKGEWHHLLPMPGGPNTMLVRLPHLSLFSKATAVVTETKYTTGFLLARDAVAADNTTEWGTCQSGDLQIEGVCVGMSFIAQKYFNDFPERLVEGLRCRWCPYTSWQVACAAQGMHWGESLGEKVKKDLFRAVGRFGQILDFTFFVDALKFSLKNKLVMAVDAMDVQLSLPDYHAFVVIGWEQTSPDSGYFTVYDNQDNDQLCYLSYTRTLGLTRMNYQAPSGQQYNVFFVLKDHYNPPIKELIESYPSEHVCGESIDLISDFQTFQSRTQSLQLLNQDPTNRGAYVNGSWQVSVGPVRILSCSNALYWGDWGGTPPDVYSHPVAVKVEFPGGYKAVGLFVWQYLPVKVTVQLTSGQIHEFEDVTTNGAWGFWGFISASDISSILISGKVGGCDMPDPNNPQPIPVVNLRQIAFGN